MANNPALLDGLSRTKINVRGVEDIQIFGLPSAAGATDTPASLGYVKSVEFKQEATAVEFIDSNGNYVDTLNSGFKVMVNAVVLQTSKEMANFMLKLTDKNFFAVYIRAKVTDNKFQEIYIPVAKIKPSATLSFANSERIINVEITALMGKHTIATNISVGPALAPVLLSTPVGEYFVMTENAVAQGTYTTGTNDEIYTNFV